MGEKGDGKRRPREKSDESNERCRHVARNRVRYGIALLVQRFSDMAAVRAQMSEQSAHAHTAERPFLVLHHVGPVCFRGGLPTVPHEQSLK